MNAKNGDDRMVRNYRSCKAKEEDRLIQLQKNKSKNAGKNAQKELQKRLVHLAADGKGIRGVPSTPADQWSRWRMKAIENPSHAPEEWFKLDHDDSGWDQVTLPTAWPPAHVGLLRTTFKVKDASAFESLQVRAVLYKLHNMRVYLNGHLVAKVNNIPKFPISFPLTPYAMEILKNGSNTLAVSTEHGKRWVEFSFKLMGRLKDDAKTGK